MLEKEIKQQLEQYLDLLENDIVIKVSVGDDNVSKETFELVNEIAEMSSMITVEEVTLERTPSFSINRKGEPDSGVVFAGIPLGHEFTSLVLALLQVSGRAPKIEDSRSEEHTSELQS